MEPETKVSKNKNKRNILLTIIIIFTVLMLFSASAFAALTLQNDKVYKGVHLGAIDVSGMDVSEMRQLLDETYNDAVAQMSVSLKSPDFELSEAFTEFDVGYDTEAALEQAYAIGRSGNIFRRLYDIARSAIRGVTINVSQTFDEGKIESFVDKFSVQVFEGVKEGALLVTDDKVILRSGRHGTHIDKAKTIDLVKNMIISNKSGTISPEIIVTEPTKIFDVDELYDQIISEYTDASYKFEGKELVLTPHSVGRDVDKNMLERIISELKQTEDTERLLPVHTVQPSITSQMAESMLFRDELGVAQTSFGAGTQNGRNRKHNMEISVVKIDNLILLPGEEFSFNEIVGPRDAAHGYKTAHIYINGRIEDGIGGGICQVSTTIYNAVLKADLEVTERKNHSFTVGYVPLGQDATAYYGGTDFRFINSTNWPIKLNSHVKGNKIYFSIIGTLENPSKTVIISNKILSRTPFTTQTTEDPTLPPGTTKELQEGMDGFVVDTYKIIKEDGKVISQTKLHTSRYRPCTEILLAGPTPAGDDAVTDPDDNGAPSDSGTTPLPGDVIPEDNGDTGSVPGGSTPPKDGDTESAHGDVAPPKDSNGSNSESGDLPLPLEEISDGQEIIE